MAERKNLSALLKEFVVARANMDVFSFGEFLTDRARKVLAIANSEGIRMNHEYIGTEHILLGIVKEGSGIGANVFKNFDIDLRKVRLEVEKLVKSGPDAVPANAKLPFTPRTSKALSFAVEEAVGLNHNYVGTEHLLLGLIREEDGVAAAVLKSLGLKLEEVRENVLWLLGTKDPNTRSSAPPSPSRKDPDPNEAHKLLLFMLKSSAGFPRSKSKTKIRYEVENVGCHLYVGDDMIFTRFTGGGWLVPNGTEATVVFQVEATWYGNYHIIGVGFDGVKWELLRGNPFNTIPISRIEFFSPD